MVGEASGLFMWSITTAQVRRAVRQSELGLVSPANLWSNVSSTTIKERYRKKPGYSL